MSGHIVMNTSANPTGVAPSIKWFSSAYGTWVDYMGQGGKTKMPNGQLCPGDAHVSSWAKHSAIEGSAGYGWMWESLPNNTTSSATPLMSLTADTGNLSVRGSVQGTQFLGPCTGSAGSVAWNNVSGKPGSYPPSSHTHSDYVPYTSTADAGFTPTNTTIGYLGTSAKMRSYLKWGSDDGCVFRQAYNANYTFNLFGDYRNGRIATYTKNNGTFGNVHSVLFQEDTDVYMPRSYFSLQGTTLYITC